MDSTVKMNFNGTYMKAQPCGTQHVVLKKYGEHYGAVRPASNINNILFGTLHIETVGNQTTTNYKTGHVSVIEFKPVERWGNREINATEGFIYASSEDAEKRNNPLWWLKGNYMEEMTAYPCLPNQGIIKKKAAPIVDESKDSFTVFKKVPYPEDYKWNFLFGAYTMTLNNITPELQARISPNDSRLRPDMRALENGDIPTAAAEKDRIQAIEETRIKEHKAAKLGDYKPIYFE
jgi:hypothetical protein